MSNYVGRRFSIDIDGKPFIETTSGRQFRMVFNVLNDFGGFNSYCDVAINNLSKSTMNQITKGKTIDLKLGYVDQIDTVFTGKIRNTFRERSGPDTSFRMICHGYDCEPWVEKPLGVNAQIKDIIDECALAMDLPTVFNVSDFSDIKPYAGGFTCSGDPRVILDKLAKAHSFSYIVENGKLLIVRNNAVRKGQITQISQFMGLEGIPKVTERGVDVTTRLNSQIKLGGQFQITSDYKTFNFSNIYFNDVPESAGTGIYKVQRLVHSGDTWGDEFSTHITGVL